MTLADAAVDLVSRGESAAAYDAFDAYVRCGGELDPFQLCVFGLCAIDRDRHDVARWCRELAQQATPVVPVLLHLLDRRLGAGHDAPCMSVLELRAKGATHVQ